MKTIKINLNNEKSIKKGIKEQERLLSKGFNHVSTESNTDFAIIKLDN